MMNGLFQDNRFLKFFKCRRICLILISTFICLFILNSCDLPTAPGPQPKTLIETDFETQLNIFGVLRADSVAGSSFIHVERAVTTSQMYTGEGVIDTTATVLVTDSLSGEVFRFEPIEDSLHAGYYYNAGFTAIAGRCYFLEVSSGDLPTLTGVTAVPTRPQVAENSLILNDEELRFTLRLTADTDQYICYLLAADNYVQKQILNHGGATATITFSLTELGAAPVGLMIVGYDSNLMVYSNSTPSFIPQTYHEIVSTVENGYGCFGSLAVTTLKF